MKIRFWERGFGTALLSAALIFLCFLGFCLVVQQYTVYNTAVRTQTVADTMADGAAVYAEKPMNIDRLKTEYMLNKLMAANQQYDEHITYKLLSYDIANDLTRTGYKDHLLTVHLSGSADNVAGFGMDKQFVRKVTSRIKIYAQIPQHVRIDDADREYYEEALSQVSVDSPQYSAIAESMSYYLWKYSDDMPWEDGARNAASFVLSCYMGRTPSVPECNNGNMQTLIDDLTDTGAIHYISESDIASGAFGVSSLLPGDIVFFYDSSDPYQTYPAGIGGAGIYLGVSSDGLPRMISADKITGNVNISVLSGFNTGDKRLAAYARI